MNINNHIYDAYEPCTELVQVTQYSCDASIPAKSNALEKVNLTSEIRVKLSHFAPCTCFGCQYYVEDMRGEVRYCCNSNAIWYLFSTGCKCDQKKLSNVKSYTFARENDQMQQYTLRQKRGVKYMAVYTVSDIQRILRISRTAAYALVNSGLFPVIRIGKSIRVSKVVFDNWMNSQAAISL